MSVNINGYDITSARKQYDEALQMQGVPCKYQYPSLATSNNQGEPEIDSYSEMIETAVFFDGNPKVKTYRRMGWVTEQLRKSY